MEVELPCRYGLQRSKPKKRSGFTLLEVVATMVLMTMLFAALTSLLRSFSEQRRVLEKIGQSHPSTGPLEALLRRDLTNARFIRATPKVLAMVGNLASNRTTGSPAGGRAEVTYRIETIANNSWIVRKETQLDVLSSDRVVEEPIWRGATGFQVTSLNTLFHDEFDEYTEPPPPGMTELPERIAVIVVGENNQPLVRLSVVHHWEDN